MKTWKTWMDSIYAGSLRRRPKGSEVSPSEVADRSVRADMEAGLCRVWKTRNIVPQPGACDPARVFDSLELLRQGIEGCARIRTRNGKARWISGQHWAMAAAMHLRPALVAVYEG